MKMPRTVKRYCPYCKAHTEQEVERVKKKKASELKWGQRRFRKVTAGYGGFPRPGKGEAHQEDQPQVQVHPVQEGQHLPLHPREEVRAHGVIT